MTTRQKIYVILRTDSDVVEDPWDDYSMLTTYDTYVDQVFLNKEIALEYLAKAEKLRRNKQLNFSQFAESPQCERFECVEVEPGDAFASPLATNDTERKIKRISYTINENREVEQHAY